MGCGSGAGLHGGGSPRGCPPGCSWATSRRPAACGGAWWRWNRPTATPATRWARWISRRGCWRRPSSGTAAAAPPQVRGGWRLLRPRGAPAMRAPCGLRPRFALCQPHAPSLVLPAADAKSALLCYEGLAELLAFQGKVGSSLAGWLGRKTCSSAGSTRCTRGRPGCRAPARQPPLPMPGLRIPTGCHVCVPLPWVAAVQEPAARSVFQRGSELPRVTARYWRQWATFEKRCGDLEVGCGPAASQPACRGGARLRVRRLGRVCPLVSPLHMPLLCLCPPACLPHTPLNTLASLPASPCLQRSAALFCKASQADPRDDRTWLQWGLLERRRKRPDAALRCFAQGTKASPRNPYLWQASRVLGGSPCSALPSSQQDHLCMIAATASRPSASFLSAPQRVESVLCAALRDARRCMACCCSSRARWRRRARCCARVWDTTQATRSCERLRLPARRACPACLLPLCSSGFDRLDRTIRCFCYLQVHGVGAGRAGSRQPG